MDVKTAVKVAIASALAVVSTVRAETAAPPDEKKPQYLIDYLSLNGRPLRQEDGEKRGRVFMITGSLNAFGSVTLGLNSDPEEEKKKKEENKNGPPYFDKKNLYELAESIHGIYLIRAEVKQKNSSYWQKVETPNAFARIIAPYDPEYDPYKSEPGPREKDIGIFYISDYVLNNTGYFEKDVAETVFSPMDFTCMPAQKYEELKAAIAEFNSFADNLSQATYEPAAQSKTFDTLNRMMDVELKAFTWDLETNADGTVDVPLEEIPDIKALLLEYRDDVESYRARLAALQEVWKSNAVADEAAEAEKQLNEALSKLDTVRDKTDEFRTTLKWVDFAYTSSDIMTFNAANCYVRDDKDKSVPYSAQDGDELRIQIFRFEAPISRPDVILYTQPALETEIHATFRDYGQFITISPALFYAARIGSEFDSSNYNFFEKEPSIGLNIYWRYEGPSFAGRWVANYLPGLSLAALGYSYKETTAENETTVVDMDPQFSVGLHVCPFPSLRKYFTFYMILYDFQWDNKLIGFSLAPGLKADKLFENNKAEKIRINR